MMSSNFRSQIEELGSRVLTSTAPPPWAPTVGLDPTFTVSPIVPPTAAVPSRPIRGSGTGVYYTIPEQFNLPDLGTLRQLRGTVNIAGFGPASLSGSVRGLGYVNEGRATGEVTLTTAHGSATLVLRGPMQRPGAMPSEFVYTVKSATGDLQGAMKGYGLLQLDYTATGLNSGRMGISFR